MVGSCSRLGGKLRLHFHEMAFFLRMHLFFSVTLIDYSSNTHLFSRVHATLYVTVSVGRSVGRSVIIFLYFLLILSCFFVFLLFCCFHWFFVVCCLFFAVFICFLYGFFRVFHIFHDIQPQFMSAMFFVLLDFLKLMHMTVEVYNRF